MRLHTKLGSSRWGNWSMFMKKNPFRLIWWSEKATGHHNLAIGHVPLGIKSKTLCLDYLKRKLFLSEMLTSYTKYILKLLIVSELVTEWSFINLFTLSESLVQVSLPPQVIGWHHTRNHGNSMSKFIYEAQAVTHKRLFFFFFCSVPHTLSLDIINLIFR